MIKINYTMTARQPIFTGSDEDTGIIKSFRREKVMLRNQDVKTSWFKTENSRRKAILTILESVWKQIDFEGMGPMRRMKIWDEFSSKVLSATGVRTRFQFLNELCHSFNIRSLNNDAVSDLIQRFQDDELLSVVRGELQFLVLLLRQKREEQKKLKEDKKEKTAQYSLFDSGKPEKKEEEEIPNITFRKAFDRVPVISGNSIRGILRRLTMRDFCNRTGITKLDKNIYHQLFTGGNITDSTAYEDIARREQYISMCPMIGLFGSAIGNMTIEGDLKVGGARPLCIEHGTADVSFWELMSTEFGTRRDDSKLEDDIEIITEEKDEKQTNQMKYGYETLIKGTMLNHSFVCVTSNDLIESAFWHMLDLFRERPFVGGSSAIGNGEISMDYDIPENGNEIYLKYLDENQDKIREYFSYE